MNHLTVIEKGVYILKRIKRHEMIMSFGIAKKMIYNL